MRVRIVKLSLALMVASTALAAQQSDEPLPDEARKRLDYAVGSWSSRSEALDEAGKVTGIRHSEDRRRFVIEDRVLEISGTDVETGQTFRAWEYYDVDEQKYCLTSIDRNGRIWTMKGDLGELFRWTSDSRPRADGTQVAIRFTHKDMEADSFFALGELSTDGGKTWKAFSRQFMTRKAE